MNNVKPSSQLGTVGLKLAYATWITFLIILIMRPG